MRTRILSEQVPGGRKRSIFFNQRFIAFLSGNLAYKKHLSAIHEIISQFSNPLSSGFAHDRQVPGDQAGGYHLSLKNSALRNQRSDPSWMASDYC